MTELTPKQQIIELIKSSQNILITSHKNPDGDAIGSLLALGKILALLKKKVTMVVSGEVSPSFNFLPDLKSVKKNLAGGKSFTITIDTTDNANGEIKLGYKHRKEENKLDIIVTPSNGRIDADKIEMSPNRPRFDLIVVLDTPDIERLGVVYDDNTDIFYETPVINIDHHPSNDHYAKVNWVELTATSTCEMLVALAESLAGVYGKKLLDEDVATKLLTGIITDTGSFQNPSTTPKSFTVAAQLVGVGARQQDIVKHIFKTKPLTTLHLWGKALTRVTRQESGFIWSWVSAKEIEELNANAAELSGLIDELFKSAPEADFALLISERKSEHGGYTLHGSLRSINPLVDVSTLASVLGGGGHTKAAAFEQPRSGGMESQLKKVITAIESEYLKVKKSLEFPE